CWVGRWAKQYGTATAAACARTGGSSVSIPARSRDTVYDPWHYVPMPAPSPAPCATVHPSRTGCRRPRWSACGKLANADDGDRQMVDILTAVLTDGLPALEAACARSSDVVLNIYRASLMSRLLAAL